MSKVIFNSLIVNVIAIAVRTQIKNKFRRPHWRFMIDYNFKKI